MSRTSIIALLVFGAILGYFLSFGADTTRKFQASVYQMLAPFFTTGSGLQKQITSVRTGLKSLEELEKENTALRVDNRQLRATNSALRDVEHCDEYSVHLLPSRPPPPDETGEAAAHQAPGPAESAERPGTSYLLARRAELVRAGSHQKHAQEDVARVAQAVEGLYRKCHVDLESPRAGGLVTGAANFPGSGQGDKGGKRQHSSGCGYITPQSRSTGFHNLFAARTNGCQEILPHPFTTLS